jgi:hypothetical protein
VKEPGIPCSGCGRRGMRRLGERLWRCEREGCPHEGETCMLFVGHEGVYTLPMATGMLLVENRRAAHPLARKGGLGIVHLNRAVTDGPLARPAGSEA